MARLRVPIPRFFAAHTGHSLADPLNSIGAMKGLDAPKQQFDLGPNMLTQFKFSTRRPGAPAHTRLPHDLVNCVSDSIGHQFVDLNVARQSFRIQGINSDRADLAIFLAEDLASEPLSPH
jgi:hypothetical protein